MKKFVHHKTPFGGPGQSPEAKLEEIMHKFRQKASMTSFSFASESRLGSRPKAPATAPNGPLKPGHMAPSIPLPSFPRTIPTAGFPGTGRPLLVVWNLENRPLLKNIYFLLINDGSQFYTFGLWNWCRGTSTEVEQCGISKIGYMLDPTAPFFNAWNGKIAQDAALSSVASVVSILFIPGVLAVGGGWLLGVCSAHRRYTSCLAGVLVLFGAGISALGFVLAIACYYQVQRLASSPAIQVEYGPATWLTMVATGMLFVAAVSFLVGCLFPHAELEDLLDKVGDFVRGVHRRPAKKRDDKQDRPSWEAAKGGNEETAQLCRSCSQRKVCSRCSREIEEEERPEA
ncbi:uncharacterized protein VTP21DRAFT_10497 [Calcarisporiella thermophila]|uniref:uncharacterized protein n=1 Tax=Calcarisporiella thermophila TaxID=911321 RepID=UPI0037427BD7